MNVLSLFTGIGGLDLGLQRAGMTIVGQVEIDAYCQAVLTKHWPEVPRHDDVRTAPEWWRREPRPAIRVVAGGFPCQPFSPAGLQCGIADERWGWPWFADAIRAIRPDYVIMENVPDILRHPDAFGWILADLADLGFDADWCVLSACSMGAPHRRRRLFLVAYPAGTGLQGLHETQRRINLQSAQAAVWRDWPTEPAVARVADGLPRGLVKDEIKGLGNAVVPQVAEYVGRLLLGHGRVGAA